MEQEYKINARGLSGPGARMMVETALAARRPAVLRVVVSTADAADVVSAYLEKAAAEVKVDQVGQEYHILAEFAGV